MLLKGITRRGCLKSALLLMTVYGAGCIPMPNDYHTPTSPAETASDANADAGPSWIARFETTKGTFDIKVNPEWAPLGAERFRELVEQGFYDDTAFFRVVPGFIVQWGMHGDPAVGSLWQENRIQDDPVSTSNKRGTITFATSGKNSRTTQLFINFGDNTHSLDGQGFSPFGEVVAGMDVVDSINAEYGEQPDQQQITYRGNEYLKKSFPNLDYILKVTVVESEDKAEGAEPGGA